MAEYTFQETTLYKKAFKQAKDVFEMTKSFPKEETYSLTDQIRRSSRSVCANYAEAQRKKRYPANFILKLTDCDAENSETLVWLDFALKCNYIKDDMFKELESQNKDIGKLLGHALMNPGMY
ncbi:MAG: four helix bundle protein [Saprospiraceae bacterium]|nr:four helix bundle protein [Saprospiraceae bacterium]